MRDGAASGQMRKWAVGGMTCAGCAAKLSRALETLPGVDDVRVSLMAETLSLRLDTDLTQAAAVEQTVKRLG